MPEETLHPFQLFALEDGGWGLSLSDMAMDVVADVFESNGRLPNGYGFTDTTLQAVRTRLPELEAALSFDPEAGSFFASAQDRTVLVRLASLLLEGFGDREMLAEWVAKAPWEYD